MTAALNDAPGRPARVLVVSDRTAVTPALLAAIRDRAARGPAQFRLVVTNPARAEAHPLHPERHDKAAEAERVLRAAMPDIERAAGGHVIATVSIRHDPMDAVEEVVFGEPIDEIVVAVAPHGVSHWLHQDLADRLAHLGLPVTTVREAAD